MTKLMAAIKRGKGKSGCGTAQSNKGCDADECGEGWRGDPGLSQTEMKPLGHVGRRACY